MRSETHKFSWEFGGAIVTVLLIVGLLSVLVVGFFSGAVNFRRSAEFSATRLEVSQISNDAVNLVIAQIQEATQEEGSGWASQPGVLRRWDKTGKFSAGFKLYSDETLVERDEKALYTNDFLDLQDDWEVRPWEYVDLNEPHREGGLKSYPIVDPDARDVSGIEGFDFNADESAKVEVEGNILPMPVKWIYRLKNGSLGVLNDGKKFVPADGKTMPTRENPIVGRFAFWTDDESCRLNPNVHAGGFAWGAPLAGGSHDMNRSRFTPAKNEWQRYPGHPATTSLGPVFAPNERDLFFQKDEMAKIYGLVPRVVAGGSESGTTYPNANGKEPNGLVADNEPILDSIDELLMNSNREVREFPKAVPKGGEAEFLNRVRFFLSAHSSAPETTFSGRPRVSIWPTFAGKGETAEDRRTIHDRVLRFCAEQGIDAEGERIQYHFQRKNADSSSVDFSEIRRNRELLAYLDRALSKPLPGIGKSFAAKYSRAERLQILTEIFDYIRCTNRHDDNIYGEDWTNAFSPEPENSADHKTFTNGRIGDKDQFSNPNWAHDTIPGQSHKGYGQVTPIRIDHGGGVISKGIGRFFTFQEIGVQVIACADAGDGTGGGAWVPADPGSKVPPYEKPSGQRFSNFPPLPLSVEREEESTWPTWLKSLKGDSPELVEDAFDSKNWNWQLAWLDPAYAAAMPAGKFDRSYLSDAAITRLNAGETLVQAGLIWSMVCPSLGRGTMNPDFVIDFEIEKMDFQSSTGQLFSIGWKSKPTFGINGPGSSHWASNRVSAAVNDDIYGGIKLPHFFMKMQRPNSKIGRLTPLDKDFSRTESFEHYRFVTRPFRVSNHVEMNSGSVKARIFASGGDKLTEFSASQIPKPELVQELEFAFEKFSIEAPELSRGFPKALDPFYQAISKIDPMTQWSLGRDGINPEVSSTGRMATVNHASEPLLDLSDVIQSVGIASGDGRLVATKPKIRKEDGLFVAHSNYGKKRRAHEYQTTLGKRQAGAGLLRDSGVFDWAKSYPSFTQNNLNPGDFDTGIFQNAPGAWINTAEEGNGHHLESKSAVSQWSASGKHIPYALQANGYPREFWHSYSFNFSAASYFTPNRILNSPGMFGSLPAGTTSNESWRTLLFRPDVKATGSNGHPGSESAVFPPGVKATGSNGHPGSESAIFPPDHLMLDLFWMPIVEPWSISETFSTKGKVNLNHQILPFRHIKRDTALRGVFKSETMLCVPNEWSQDYKSGFGRGKGYHWRNNPHGGNLQKRSLRTTIVEDETLAQFEAKFNDPESPTIFRTASEICDIHLIPEEFGETLGSEPIQSYTPTLAQMKNGKYWSDHQPVGDDARERPYSNIYSRITTRSNVYRVYICAQTLKQSRRDDDSEYESWSPLIDQVESEWKGSHLIERYLDPGNTDIPDYATDENAPSLDKFYRYRIVMVDRFAP